MIQSFRCKKTKSFFEGGPIDRRWKALENVIVRKLKMLNAVNQLKDLLIPPNNRLEALKGNRKGQHSIRVNDQFRICFEWTDNGPANVEVVDYQ